MKLNAQGQRINQRFNLYAVYSLQVTMLTGNLLCFSSNKDMLEDTNSGNGEDLMPKTHSKKVTSLTDPAESQVAASCDYEHPGPGDLSKISYNMLMDEDLEESMIRPLFWNMVETYIDRFQVFPFDVIKALFRYLELKKYPEDELHDLVEQLEKLYTKQHGRPMRGSRRQSASDETGVQLLDDEINELRETLKYAAIVGERQDGWK